jgi:quercetin dioxygenase-like cupin family protein
MSARRNGASRFVTASTARIELAPWGRHWWLSEPELTGTKLLTLVRVTMRPGTGHRFHYHPSREEIIYVVDGVAEQWVDREKRRLKAGECAFIPKKVVHAIFNSSRKPMTFLAILSPAKAPGPFLIDCYEREPWRRLGPQARPHRIRPVR